MPIFVYTCEACGENHNVLTYTKDSGEARPLACPSCGMCASLGLAVAGAALRFKGAGFYAVDYPRQRTLPQKTQVSVGAEVSDD